MRIIVGASRPSKRTIGAKLVGHGQCLDNKPLSAAVRARRLCVRCCRRGLEFVYMCSGVQGLRGLSEAFLPEQEFLMCRFRLSLLLLMGSPQRGQESVALPR